MKWIIYIYIYIYIYSNLGYLMLLMENVKCYKAVKVIEYILTHNSILTKCKKRYFFYTDKASG